MEAVRDDEQSPPKAGRTGLLQGRLSEVSGGLTVACLFTAAGGYMDAFSYLAHGHVFANSQSGNFVFFAVFASGGQWAQAGRHLPPIVAFVAALQNTSFDKIGSLSFNSAMTTGNLREATSGLVLWIVGRETAENRRKAISLGLVCCSFLGGAFFGASYTRFHMEHDLVPCVAIVAAGFLLTWRLRRKATVGMLPNMPRMQKSVDQLFPR